MNRFLKKERIRKKIIVLPELKELLLELSLIAPNLGIRLKTNTKGFASCFMNIVEVSDDFLLLKNEVYDSFNAISNLTEITELELDEAVRGYKAFTKYKVVGSAITFEK